MTAGIARLSERRAWNALTAHHTQIRELQLRKLCADDPTRGERMTLEAVGLYLDYSKNRITDETLNLLMQLAKESGLRARIDAMFRGEKNQHHRKPGRFAGRPARSERSIHRCRWRSRKTVPMCHARRSGHQAMII